MKSLAGRVAVVTGAGSGIGREIAIQLADEKVIIAVLDIRIETAEETCKMISDNGGEAHPFQVDISDRAAVEEVAREIRREVGTVSILVNNAGVMVKTQPMLSVPYEHVELAVNVNIYGMIHMTYTFLPEMLQQDEGCLVNVSSMGGIIGFMHQTPYTMTKFAIRGFTEALRMELLDSNVRVIGVYPGGIATNVARNSPTMTDEEKRKFEEQMAAKKLTSPEKVAKKTISGIKSGKARILVAPETHIVDFVARHLPNSAGQLLHPLVKKMLAASNIDQD